MNELVSICITSFNYGRYINDAIQSALRQTYQHIEVVICDNGSCDETHVILDAYRDDPRVRVFVNEQNVGMCRNHNLAIQRSRGSYLVLLSADDIIFPRHVERLLRRIQDAHDPVLIAAGHGVCLNEQLAAQFSPQFHGKLPVAYSHRDDFGGLIFNYYQLLPAKLIARVVYDTVGLFHEDMITAFDVEHAVRTAAADVPIAFIPDVVAGTRMHGDQSGHRTPERMHALFNDKCHIIAHALKPEHAWRVEGFESPIISMFELDLHQLTHDGAASLSDEQKHKIAEMKSVFSERELCRPQWPETEPMLSVVVVSDGQFALLKMTLDDLALQLDGRLQVKIVQTSGYDVTPWIESLPNTEHVSVVQMQACKAPREAARLGLELVRGEYTAYLQEGQRISAGLYDEACRLLREHDAQVFVLPKARIQQFQLASPGLPVVEDRPYSLSQLIHRRAILRSPTVYVENLYEKMVTLEESDFIELLTASFRVLIETVV